MRTTRLIFILITLFSLKGLAQSPVSAMGYQQRVFNNYHLLNDSNQLNKKWSVTVYGALGVGMGFYNGGNNAFFPVQIGLQVNRRLTNNLYAFAGASTTPVMFNFNRTFSNIDPNKNYMYNPAFNPNGFGMYQQVQAGLMYVNDDRTFSISGSIGIGTSRSPFYPANGIKPQNQPVAESRK